MNTNDFIFFSFYAFMIKFTYNKYLKFNKKKEKKNLTCGSLRLVLGKCTRFGNITGWLKVPVFKFDVCVNRFVKIDNRFSDIVVAACML